MKQVQINMEIRSIIEQLMVKHNKANEEKFKHNPEKEAAYWLHLGQANEIGDLIVLLIEEYQKENKLSEFLRQQLKIFKLP